MVWPPPNIPWYYTDDHTCIAVGDAVDLLHRMPKVDLVLTDPPYANGTKYGSYQDTLPNLINLIQLTLPIIRSKSNVVMITPGVANVYYYPRPDWILCWAIPAGVGSGPWGFCCWQPILVYGADPYLAAGLGRRPDTIIESLSAESNGHPCPKPIAVWERLLLRGSPYPDQVVLDPFMGSGTTLRAAVNMGRRAIGLEIDRDYADIAVKRLAQLALDLR